MLRAILWDVDGTIAETERDGHRVAFNRAFADAGLPWCWDVERYGELLRIAGGYERLMHDLERRAAEGSVAPMQDAERAALARRVHRAKNAHYAGIVAAGGIDLRPGVRRLIETSAAEGIRQAIATTTSRANVDALLRPVFGANWPERFDAIVCAEDAPVKKPDPSVYRIALERLALDGHAVIAIEDSPNGLAAAIGAGIATLITRSHYFRSDDFEGASALCDDLDTPLRWADGAADRTDAAVLRRVLASRGAMPTR